MGVNPVPSTPEEISRLWRHVHRQMLALLRRAGKEYDLPPFSLILLRHIEEEPGTTLSDLARRVGAAKSHTSTIVDQLVQEGYVEKRSDPADQRLVRLHMTPEAKRLCAAKGDRFKTAWSVVLEEYDGETDEVARFLRSLHAALRRANARLDRETSGASARPGSREVSAP